MLTIAPGYTRRAIIMSITAMRTPCIGKQRGWEVGCRPIDTDGLLLLFLLPGARRIWPTMIIPAGVTITRKGELFRDVRTSTNTVTTGTYTI